MQIPDELFAKYREFADDFISDNFGVNCQLLYPPKREQCPNCVFDSINQQSANRYKTGGPYPFTFGVCPYCNGAGIKEVTSSDTIKLRVYEDRKYWVKLEIPANLPDGSVQVIGFIYDLPKVQKANNIKLYSDISGYNNWLYVLAGEPKPHGFKKNRYFIGYLKREG